MKDWQQSDSPDELSLALGKLFPYIDEHCVERIKNRVKREEETFGSRIVTWVCTRKKDHAGPHVACGEADTRLEGNIALAVWGGTDEEREHLLRHAIVMARLGVKFD